MSQQQDNSVQAPKYEHMYARACERRPKEYWDYENGAIEWGTIDPYEVTRKIGRGKFSEVFIGSNRINGEICVIKALKPVKPKKILREITILQNLFGGPNVIKLLDVAIDRETQTPILVFEHVNNTDFRSLYPQLTDLEVRYYMFEILRTLEFCHSMGIFHRDVKPHNIMIDHANKKLRLIDWGLGEYFLRDTEYNCRVASRYYKGPELLVNFRLYDYSLDIWSLGCVLAGIVFQKEPFFHGRDNNEQLIQILKVLGTANFFPWIKKFNIAIPSVYDGQIRDWPRKGWDTFASGRNLPLYNPDVLDLLDRMLIYDHTCRILPKDAMLHPWFDPVRY